MAGLKWMPLVSKFLALGILPLSQMLIMMNLNMGFLFRHSTIKQLACLI